MKKINMEISQRNFHTFSFSGLRFFSGSMTEVIRIVENWINQKEHKYICVNNIHGTTEAYYDKEVMRAQNQAGINVPDGMPLVWLGQCGGYRKTKRIYGPDLMLSVCLFAEQKGIPVYLYGTNKKTLAMLFKKLLFLFPKLNIAGSEPSLFRSLSKTEDHRLMQRINKSGAQILFVGLGIPLQDVWMKDHINSIHCNVSIGVGAAFDFISGTKRQAPIWIRNIGLEWLFRLTQEPTRLWRRYLVSGATFIWLVVKHFML